MRFHESADHSVGVENVKIRALLRERDSPEQAIRNLLVILTRIAGLI